MSSSSSSPRSSPSSLPVPGSPRARRGLARRGALLVLASLLSGAVTTLTLPVLAPAGADDPIAYSISVSPEGPYTDGQAVRIRIEAPRGTRVTNSGFCHPDMPPATSQRDLTEWCTATVGNGVTGGTEPADPDGVVELTVRAGVGAAEKDSPALGTSHRWRCDDTSPCRIALEITPEVGAAVFDTSVALTYHDDDPTTGCGGPAAGQISTAAPDRLTEAWVAWTIGECGGEGTATSASFTNDGAALAQFTSGAVDLAYAGVPVGRTGFGDATRPAVHTPVGLNATVLAVAGFHPTASSVPGTPLWKPIDDVRMSTAELNALLSGHLTLDEGLQDSLKARNPQLAEQGTRLGFANPNGLAGPQATTAHMSGLLTARMGDAWAYPDLPSKYDTHAGQPLGPFADYNGVYNSLAMINLLTGKPQLVGDVYKKLAEKPQAVSLVHFYLTDLATARQLGIAPVALQDAAGDYVLPTPETLAAAVPAMVQAADGTRALDPTEPSGGYPLTFVEYAVTPSEQIVDETCAPVEATAAAVRDWVGYLAGDGQDDATAAGLVALPEALRTDAAASLDRIAAAEPTTGPCAATPPPEETDPPPPAGGLPSGGLPSGGLPSGGVGDLPGETVGTGGVGAGSTPTAGAPAADDPTDGRADSADEESIDDAQAVVASTEVPRLRGPLGAGVLVATITLVGLVALTSATGWLSGGRRRTRLSAP